jgi:hypothetical protein
VTPLGLTTAGAGTNMLPGGRTCPGVFWASIGAGAGLACQPVRLRFVRFGLDGPPAVMNCWTAGFNLSVTALMRSGVGLAREC